MQGILGFPRSFGVSHVAFNPRELLLVLLELGP